jgi:hypothetical protein
MKTDKSSNFGLRIDRPGKYLMHNHRNATIDVVGKTRVHGWIEDQGQKVLLQWTRSGKVMGTDPNYDILWRLDND